jgi:hypothetical protein
VSDPVTLIVSEDEALVLFEWLSTLDGSTLDAPERDAVLGLLAALERTLVAPFQPNYGELLMAARARLSSTD